MHYFDSTIIEGDIFLHQVGNKQNDEKLILSNQAVYIDDSVKTDLKRFFLSHFKQSDYYRFYHDSSLSLNEVYCYISEIFANPQSMLVQSKYLAKLLYRTSIHPNIKGGDFYVVHFRNCLLDGVMTDAIGLFKSENKDSFLKIIKREHSFELIQEIGININKLDKGCLVFNLNKEYGYVVSIIDNSNKSEAKYWIDNFLQVQLRNDDYTQTRNVVSLCKSFIKTLPGDLSKSDKAVMMNRVMETLNDENISVDELATKAFGPDLASSEFRSFRNEFENTHEISFDDSFVSKKESVNSRSICNLTTIKLDNNFDVRIHGGEQYIEQGYDDERKMKFYKLYYTEEK